MRLTMFTVLLVAALCSSASAVVVSFVDHDQIIVNPERGIFRWGPLENSTNFHNLSADGISLVFARIDLDGFQTQPISAARLTEISNALARMRASGLKGFVRVSYNDEIGQPDASLAQIEAHLQQLAPIFNANSDVIAWFEAGFIGSWGEWHSSTNGLDTTVGRLAVMDLLLAYLPADKFILVRTPGYKWDLYPDDVPLTEPNAYTNTGVARVGHHNDCFLASDTDLGTYPSGDEALWKSRIAAETLWVPLGGETCGVFEPRSTCTGDALSEMEALRWTYLHLDYHPDVIQAFIDDGCWNEIQRRLGYRFEFVSATVPDTIVTGQPVSVSVQIRNDGWAPLYNTRPVFLRMMDGSTVVGEWELAAEDPRDWRPGEVSTVAATVTAPSSLPASVSLALWLPDADTDLHAQPEYSIRVASNLASSGTDVWEPTLGHSVIAEDIPTQTMPAGIVIDGVFTDWDGISPAHSDPPGDEIGAGATADFTDVFIASDESNLFLRFRSAVPFAVPTTGVNIFVDTDNTSATAAGPQEPGGGASSTVGAEVLIQSDLVYDHRTGWPVGDTDGCTVDFGPQSGTQSDVELSISLTGTHVGDGAALWPSAGSEIAVLLQSLTDSFAASDIAPDAGGGGIVHVLGSAPTPVRLSVFSVN